MEQQLGNDAGRASRLHAELGADLERELRAAINPAYEDVRGTESYERKRLLGEIDRLRAEVAMLRQGDTCARQCEGTAYRVEARQMRAILADWMTFAADVQCSDACGQDWLDGLRTRTGHHNIPPNA